MQNENGKYPKLRNYADDKLSLDYQGPRSLLKGIGFTDEDLNKPRVAVINTWSEINPGHIHLKEVAEFVCRGVKEAGGFACNFNALNLCDAIGGGPYVLPSRDLLVNEIEVIVEAHKFDAMVLLGTCDKIIPALLMASGRLDLPTIIVTGGYMATGCVDNKNIDFIDIGISVNKVKEGNMTLDELEKIIDNACPAPGACGMMGTANTMILLTETIGLSMPENSTTAATSPKLNDIAYKAGLQILELWKNNITARKIITDDSIENAIKLCMAIGGSSNTIIHVPAVATESELTIDCSEIYAKASLEVPLLIGIRPNGEYTMKDFENAGGLGALLNQIKDILNLEGITVTGKTLGENIKGYDVKNKNVIRSLDNPLENDGGLILCKGNLVPEGAFIKQSAVPKKLNQFKGKARVFNTVKSAIDALQNGIIVSGDAIVIVYQGVKAGPQSAYQFTSVLKGSHLKDEVITITDGRLSGAASGACFGYASPEAALGGPLAIVKDGDIIEYDIKERSLNINISDEEIKNRLKEFVFNRPSKRGYLGIYQKCVGSILKGAVLSGD